MKSLKRVGDSIRRRRVLAVLAVFLFIGTLLLGGALLLDARIYLTAEEAVEEIYTGNSGINIRWDDRVTGTSGYVDSENPVNYEVVAWTNLYSYLFHRGRVGYDELDAEIRSEISREQYEQMDTVSCFALETMEDTNFVYVSPRGNRVTAIWDAGQPMPEETGLAIRADILYYLLIVSGISVLLFLLGWHFRGKWYGELISRLGVVAVCLAVSVVVVTAGQFYGLEQDFKEALVDSTAVAVPMTLFGFCIRQVIQLNRQDKGI